MKTDEQLADEFATQYAVNKKDDRHQCPACGEGTKWVHIRDDYMAGLAKGRILGRIEAFEEAAELFADIARLPIANQDKYIKFHDKAKAERAKLEDK